MADEDDVEVVGVCAHRTSHCARAGPAARSAGVVDSARAAPIAIVSDDDDDIELVSTHVSSHHPPLEPGLFCSLDCCSHHTQLSRIKNQIQDASLGETLASLSAGLICPHCAQPLSARDVGMALGLGKAQSNLATTTWRTMVAQCVTALEDEDAVRVALTMLQSARPDAIRWDNASWQQDFLADTFNDSLPAFVQQVALAVSLTAVILRIRLILLDQLPEEHFLPEARAKLPPSKKHHAVAAGFAGRQACAASSLYSLQRLVPEERGATERMPTVYAMARMPVMPQGRGGSKGAVSSHPLLSNAGPSHPPFGSAPPHFATPATTAAVAVPAAAAPASRQPDAHRVTSAAVAAGVGYGGESAGSDSRSGYRLGVNPYESLGFSSKASRHKRACDDAARLGMQAAVAVERATCVRVLLQLVQASEQHGSVGMVGIKTVPLAIMLEGGLASVLYDLLQESIDALIEDEAVQRDVLRLLNALCTYPEALPVLTAAIGWPPHLKPHAESDSSSSESSSEDEDGDVDVEGGGEDVEETGSPKEEDSIAAKLERMRKSCVLWEKKGQQVLDAEDGGGVDGVDSAITVVLLALEVAKNVGQAVAEWQAQQEAAGAPTNSTSTTTCAAGAVAGNATSLSGGTAQGPGATSHAPTTGPCPPPVDTESEQFHKEHEKALQELALLYDADLLCSHAFKGDASASKVTSSSSKLRMTTIMKQVTSLGTSLPAHWDSSVHVAVDGAHMDLLRVLILPPTETPYAYGAFLFDVYFPPNYPSVPPKMKFLTTGAGTCRFNPNLYQCGKVCLSLLGTWSGPTWQPGISTFLQVLVSLQAMVFCSHPYFNEPGYQTSAGSSHGDNESARYNAAVRRDTARHAILPALTKPCSSPHAVFKDVLALHWKAKAAEMRRHFSAARGDIGQYADQVLEALDRFESGTVV